MAFTAREGAFLSLVEIDKNKAYSNLVGGKFYKELDKRDKALMTELVMGVVRNRVYLDYIIRKLSNIKFGKLSINVRNILRLGIYQIEFLDKIPHSAAVNESVKLCKKYDFGASGFVNAILRNLIRQNDTLLDEKMPMEEYLSVKYSYPRWMVKRFIEEFGEDFAASVLNFGNKVAPIYIRKNRLVKENLDEEKFKKANFLPETYILNKGYSVEDDEDFALGKYIVQDAASQLVGWAVNPKKGQRILDMCAAPGGKTTHIAEMMENEGEVIAFDIHNSRINLINENAKRLKINIIKAYEKDATLFDPSLEDGFDAVLLDAPCSGLGIIRRKPDIKWNRKKEDIIELTKIQNKLLNNAGKYVKDGGTLVYSTCTLLKEENMDKVEEFLKDNEEFMLSDLSYLPIYKDTLKDGYVNLYPHVDNTDGFFICKMIKRSRKW